MKKKSNPMRALSHPGLLLGRKYSEDTANQISHFMGRELVGGLSRRDRKHKRRSINMVSRHKLLDRELLPEALETARETTPGSVLVMLNHKKISKDAIPYALKIMREGGWDVAEVTGLHDVMEILDHPKTTKENASRFLQTALTQGVGLTRNFMNREDVDENNIRKKIRTYSKMGDTQRIIITPEE